MARETRSTRQRVGRLEVQGRWAGSLLTAVVFGAALSGCNCGPRSANADAGAADDAGEAGGSDGGVPTPDSGASPDAGPTVDAGPLPDAGRLAGLLAYEGFDYEPGGFLQGRDGGAGWSEPWRLTEGGPTTPLAPEKSGVIVPGLTYVDDTGLLLVTSGEAWESSASVVFGQAQRETLASFGSGGSTRWASLLVQQADLVAGSSYAGLTLGTGYSDGGTAIVAGLSRNSASLGLLYSAGGAQTPIGWWGAGAQAFLVVRFDFDPRADAMDTASLWLNPPLRVPMGTPYLTAPVADFGELLSGVTFAWGDSRRFIVDELRLGDTAADVMPWVASYLELLAGAPRGPGSVDDLGSLARFNNGVFGLAVDAVGNVYVADTNNQTIRKVSPEGLVSTFAGKSGALGTTDAVGSAARFGYPTGVACDAQGNLFIADRYNNKVRRITPAGDVTTLAGAFPQGGSADGPGDAAGFADPYGVAVDAQGWVYVADSENHTVRKISPSGVVSTFAGLAGASGSQDGSGNQARFYAPRAVGVDGAGTVYVLDELNHNVRKISPAGDVTTLAGLAGNPGMVDGLGTAARFASPLGLAVTDDGTVYVADRANNALRRISPEGVVTTMIGKHLDNWTGLGENPRLEGPVGVAVLGPKRLVLTSGVALVIATVP